MNATLIKQHLGDIAAHAHISTTLGTVTIRNNDCEWFGKVGLPDPVDEPGTVSTARRWVVAVKHPAFLALVAKTKMKQAKEKTMEQKKQAGGVRRFIPAEIIAKHGDWLRRVATPHQEGRVGFIISTETEASEHGIPNKPHDGRSKGTKWYFQILSREIADFLRAAKPNPAEYVPVEGTQLRVRDCAELLEKGYIPAPPPFPQTNPPHFILPIKPEGKSWIESAVKISDAPGSIESDEKQEPISAPPTPTPENFTTALGDSVNHHAHYQRGGMECIEVIERLGLGYNLGNALKYLWRADVKGRRKEDLAKCAWYINREISRMEEKS